MDHDRKDKQQIMDRRLTIRGDMIRIISVRRSRKKEMDLYEEKDIRKE